MELRSNALPLPSSQDSHLLQIPFGGSESGPPLSKPPLFAAAHRSHGGWLRWKDDKSSDKCESCETKFTMMTRRHHCRLCGRFAPLLSRALHLHLTRTREEDSSHHASATPPHFPSLILLLNPFFSSCCTCACACHASCISLVLTRCDVSWCLGCFALNAAETSGQYQNLTTCSLFECAATARSSAGSRRRSCSLSAQTTLKLSRDTCDAQHSPPQTHIRSMICYWCMMACPTVQSQGEAGCNLTAVGAWHAALCQVRKEEPTKPNTTAIIIIITKPCTRILHSTGQGQARLQLLHRGVSAPDHCCSRGAVRGNQPVD